MSGGELRYAAPADPDTANEDERAVARADGTMTFAEVEVAESWLGIIPSLQLQARDQAQPAVCNLHRRERHDALSPCDGPRVVVRRAGVRRPGVAHLVSAHLCKRGGCSGSHLQRT